MTGLLHGPRRDAPATASMAMILLLALLAAFGPWLVPYPGDAFDTNILVALEPPSAGHLFGTDSLGRDILSRSVLAIRVDLTIAIVTIFGSILIGVPAGLIAGYAGGWTSQLIMRVTDLFQAVPQLILALAFAAVLPPSIGSAILALTLSYWPFFCRIVYGETRRTMSAVFVDALQALGCSPARIIVLHVMPNVMPAIIVRATIGMGVTILSAASLGFLGLGATPPTPEWGLMISEGRAQLPDGWWVSFFPGAALFLTVMAFNFVGDFLRDTIDPRVRESRDR